jgi:asparagine synthase (glutamine-hydrolysing)
LAIIELSDAGQQPMRSARGNVTIIYNGELYNFHELRSELEARGYVFRSHSDTEVVLAAYEAFGHDMLARLEGIFALAIWDGRNNSLFLARDQFGVKPLYWSTSPQGILFASEIKALLAWKGMDRRVDPVALQHYLTYLYCPASRTPFLNVKKLEPGKAMIVRNGRLERHWRYYALPYDQPIAVIGANEAKHAVRDALAASVRRQMLSDVPVGAFLSGGLDSSAIVALAREHAERPLRCFSIALESSRLAAEGQPDDLPYAQAMARHLGVPLDVVAVKSDVINRFDEMIWHLDEPQGDPAPLNVYFISKLARENGIKVLLSGAAGDDIFSGYRRHVALNYEKWWRWLPAPGRRLLRDISQALPAGIPVTRRLRKVFSAALLEDDARLAHYFTWIPPDIAARMVGRGADPADAPLLEALADIPADTAPLNKMLYLETRFFLADHNLNYTDKMGMAAGVEIRVPFLDRNLVALAARLPVQFKQRGASGKWILKEAMRDLLPDALIDRPKAGFGAPVRQWLRGELSPMLDAMVAKGSVLEGHMDIEALSAIVQADRAGQIDAAYPLFAALSVESWLRQFGSTTGAVAA